MVQRVVVNNQLATTDASCTRLSIRKHGSARLGCGSDNPIIQSAPVFFLGFLFRSN
jgi:hypothetical protein